MRSKGDYALLWANGLTFGEIYDLMEADIRAPRALRVGDRVLYDENPGEISAELDTPGNASFVVNWDNGTSSPVWASDLVHELSPEEYEDLAIAVATGVIDV